MPAIGHGFRQLHGFEAATPLRAAARRAPLRRDSSPLRAKWAKLCAVTSAAVAGRLLRRAAAPRWKISSSGQCRPLPLFSASFIHKNSPRSRLRHGRHHYFERRRCQIDIGGRARVAFFDGRVIHRQCTTASRAPQRTHVGYLFRQVNRGHYRRAGRTKNADGLRN